VRSGDLVTITLELEPRSERRKKMPFGFGIGIAGERRIASDPDTSDEWGLALLPRFIRRGLAPACTLRWTRTGMRIPGGELAELGVLRMKPTMVGVILQEPVAKRVWSEIQIVAGYSFNSTAPSAEKLLKPHVAVPQAVADVSYSVAWEARLAIWREVGPRVGMMVAARYLHNRPQLTFADRSEHSWNADRLTLEAGLALTLIKAPAARTPADRRR